MGTGAFVQDRAFLDENEGHVQLVDGHVVLEVAVQAVGFLAEQNPHLGVFLQEADHLGEVRAA